MQILIWAYSFDSLFIYLFAHTAALWVAHMVYIHMHMYACCVCVEAVAPSSCFPPTYWKFVWVFTALHLLLIIVGSFACDNQDGWHAAFI